MGRQFSMSSLVKTETGRYEIKILRNERICSFCNSNKIEDENHFLLDCEANSKIRDQSLWLETYFLQNRT